MRKANFSLVSTLLILMITTLSCALPTSFPGFGSEEVNRETETWQEAVDAIKALIRGHSIPEFLIDPETPRTGDVFDPNQLLVPLDHLSLRPGYTLDFVYLYDGLGGRPFLYARKIADLPFENYDAFLASIPSDGIDASYLDFIECDGTEEGYFQWILLEIMGEQFYLYWHSGYNDAEIIASRARLEGLVEERRQTTFGEPFSHTQVRKALQLNPAPEVEIADEMVSVRVVWFTNWGGFYESVYTIKRTSPHRIDEVETNPLMDYECGVMF